jgi:ribosomal protein S18 acetylase RimI-like enzyme
MSTIIRPAKPVDIPEVRSMMREYVEWIGLDLAVLEIESEIANLPGEYDLPDGVILVAEEEHQLVGMVALRPMPTKAWRSDALVAEAAEMKRLFVRPHARGRGLATDLVNRLLDEARHRNYAEVRLDTLPMMTGAQSLYESFGFEDIEPYYDTPIAGTRFMAMRL